MGDKKMTNEVRDRIFTRDRNGFFVRYLFPPSYSHLAPPNSHLSEDSLHTFMRAIQNGNKFETACDVAVLSPTKMKKWLERGATKLKEVDYDLYEVADEDIFYCKLYVDLKRALATIESSLVNVIRDVALSNNIKAATWLLERINDSWQKTEKIDIAKTDEQVIKVYLPDNNRMLLDDKGNVAKLSAPEESEEADFEIVDDEENEEE